MKGLTEGFIGGLNIRENLIQQELLSNLSISVDNAKPEWQFTFLIVWTTIKLSIFLTECLILLILPNPKYNFRKKYAKLSLEEMIYVKRFNNICQINRYTWNKYLLSLRHIRLTQAQ